MSHPHGPDLTWAHTARGLQLRLDASVHSVPREITHQLLRRFSRGLSPTPDADLLELERHQREVILDAERDWEQTEQRFIDARDMCPDAPRHRSRHCSAEHRQARTEHRASTETLHRARVDNRQLRRFIVSLGVESGPLGAAREGWLLPAERPGMVSAVWPSAEDFVRADARRAVSAGWGAGAINAEIVGAEWRREGDDDPTVSADASSGAWTIGYIQATQELYAHRLCAHRPEEVWLLANSAPPSILRRLHQLQRRIREPNSLIRVVRAIELSRDIDVQGTEDRELCHAPCEAPA
ncbi:hypothetical protein [Amycolatopsis anabasis]|uniref:hypothetical protein n=1 Tax=Amycolatopsis anabasis TaxID=1840409 RepID=UPI00131C529B|nr:hypothetical protein [Amycolatopsis anabasis]